MNEAMLMLGMSSSSTRFKSLCSMVDILKSLLYSILRALLLNLYLFIGVLLCHLRYLKVCLMVCEINNIFHDFSPFKLVFKGDIFITLPNI